MLTRRVHVLFSIVQAQSRPYLRPAISEDYSFPLTSFAFPFASPANSLAFPFASPCSSAAFPLASPDDMPATCFAFCAAVSIHLIHQHHSNKKNTHSIPTNPKCRKREWKEEEEGNIRPISIPSTILSLTARSTVFVAFFTASGTIFLKVGDVLNALGAKEVRAAMRGAICLNSMRKDIFYLFELIEGFWKLGFYFEV
jgi:hypothetical protein